MEFFVLKDTGLWIGVACLDFSVVTNAQEAASLLVVADVQSFNKHSWNDDDTASIVILSFNIDLALYQCVVADFCPGLESSFCDWVGDLEV